MEVYVVKCGGSVEPKEAVPLAVRRFAKQQWEVDQEGALQWVVKRSSRGK